jgi:hypothetical protein
MSEEHPENPERIRGRVYKRLADASLGLQILRAAQLRRDLLGLFNSAVAFLSRFINRRDTDRDNRRTWRIRAHDYQTAVNS